MEERWDLLSCFDSFFWINLNRSLSGSLTAQITDDLSPRRDDHGMPPGFSPIRVLPHLGRSHDPHAVFNGARAKQYLPMRATRCNRKGRRDKTHKAPRLRKASKDVGKTQIKLKLTDIDWSNCSGLDNGHDYNAPIGQDLMWETTG